MSSTRPTLPGQTHRSSLGERAYEYVRDEILRGNLTVGSVVAEGAVAESLGVSKTPVRQALQLLRREGLLEVGPRRQLIVRGLTPEHRQEIVDVRLALESLAVQRACERLTVEEIDYLHVMLRRQRRAVIAGAEEQFIELDEQFHLHIARAAGLPTVERFLRQLRGFVRVMRLGSTRSAGHLFAVWEEHGAIVDALESRKPRLAVKALRAHLEHRDY